MATIWKRGDKWQVQARRQGTRSVSRSFRRKADALQWARQIESQVDRAGPRSVDVKILREMTVGDLTGRYRKTIGLCTPSVQRLPAHSTWR